MVCSQIVSIVIAGVETIQERQSSWSISAKQLARSAFL
jgi:hypothetical protein